MKLNNEKDHSTPLLSTIFIIAAFFGITMGFEKCNLGIDEGLLTSKEITLKKRPEFKYPNKLENTPKHYLIYSNEYESQFWIRGAGLSIVEDHEENLRPFRRQVNDTLKLLILTSDQNSLDNPNMHVDVYGLADSKRVYFNPAIANSIYNKQSKVFLLFSTGLLITGLAIRYKKKFKPRTA